jgi:hypothetical protein
MILNRAFLIPSVLALTSFAFAATPKPIYVSWVPPNSSFAAGSKPSLRITLDSAPDADTPISISASDSAKVTLPGASVTAVAGSRYVIVPVTLNGVDADAAVHVTASNGGASVDSPSITILHAKLERVTFNTLPVSNVLTSSTATEVKFTLTGPAGPSGYKVSLSSITVKGGSGTNAITIFSSLNAAGAVSPLVPSGSAIFRVTFTVPTITGSNTGNTIVYHGPGSEGTQTTTFSLQP